MTRKQAIVTELGADELLAPERIARSLVANDQVKYYFALLQGARDNADTPRVPVIDLKAERLASRLDDPWLDDVVASASTARVPSSRPGLLHRLEEAAGPGPGRQTWTSCRSDEPRHGEGRARQSCREPWPRRSS